MDVGPTDFEIVLDEPTAIEIGIPKGMLGSQQRTKRGSAWISADKVIQVETLEFTNDESLDSLYGRLKSIPGRVLDEYYTVPLDRDMFALHGADRDGTLFHIEFHKRGAAIKGFSIIYLDDKFWPTVLRVMSTFVPFPKDDVFEAQACKDQLRPPEIPSATVKLSSRTATVGEPFTVYWSVNNIDTSSPTYLIVIVPDAVRVSGSGFFALTSAVERNRTGVRYGLNQTRLILPLHTQFSARSGKIDVTPYTAGPLTAQWALVTGGDCEVSIASGFLESIQVRPGVPKLVINDEFSERTGGKLIRPSLGPFEIRQYRGWFEVTEAETGALIFRRQGNDPTFSPTGRFLISTSVVRERFDVFDLVAVRLVGSYEASELLWSHGDSFLYVEGARGGALTIVKTLHGPGLDPESLFLTDELVLRNEDSDEQPQPDSLEVGSGGCIFCKALDKTRLFLSIDHGIVAVRSVEDYLVYDLSGKNKRKSYERSGLGLLQIGTDFGHVVPMFDSWTVGERLRTASTEGRAVAAEVDIDVRQRMRTSGTLALLSKQEGPNASATQLPRRTRAVPDYASAVRSQESFQLFDAVAVREMRGPRDTNVLRGLQRQLARLYSSNVVKFGAHSFFQGGTQPLPNPSVVPDRDQIPEIDLTEPGRDLWYWRNGTSTYWLTQTVETHRSVHYFEFTMVASAPGRATRHVDLLSAAYQALHPDKAAKSADDDHDDDNEFDQYELGDLRGNPEDGFGRASQVTVANDRYLVLLTRPFGTAIVFDLASWEVVCGIPRLKDGANTKSLFFNKSVKHLTQINDDGSLHVYSCRHQREVLTGAVMQDELIVLDANGYFDCSDDAASYVEVRVPGVPGRHMLAQFSSVLKRPNLARDILEGTPVAPPGELHRPPVLRHEPSTSPAHLLSASSDTGLAFVQFYEDGRPGAQIKLDGRAAVFEPPSSPDNFGIVTAFAVDQFGITSAPLVVAQRARPQLDGKLYALGIGVNRYPFLPAICGTNGRQSCDLKNAVSDARNVIQSLRATGKYKASETQMLLNGEAKTDSILRQLETITASAGPSDTVVVSISGHAVNREGKLLILLSSTLPDQFAMERTSLRFEALTERLRQSKAIVIVLLDVCHAGLAGHLGAVTSEEAAREFLTRSGASMIILSASRGAQFSEERSDIGGGLFSRTFERAIGAGRSAYDLDRNGWISIAELYRGLKSDVSLSTSGRQVPMLYRNLLVGDVDLF
jgi:hypothetical protein